jgi:hypothetical protein
VHWAWRGECCGVSGLCELRENSRFNQCLPWVTLASYKVKCVLSDLQYNCFKGSGFQVPKILLPILI